MGGLNATGRTNGGREVVLTLEVVLSADTMR